MGSRGTTAYSRLISGEGTQLGCVCECECECVWSCLADNRSVSRESEAADR